MNEAWQERVPPPDDAMNYRPTISMSIKSPSASTVDDVSGMMYVALNAVQRLVHELVRASDGLVSEDNAKGEVTKLELWIQKAAATMQKQQHAITELRNMLDIYEKNVWDKTQEFANMQIEMAKGRNLEVEEIVEGRDNKIRELEAQVAELEAHYNRSKLRFNGDQWTQTDPIQMQGIDEKPRAPTVLISASKKIKTNMKHPVFLKLKCGECRSAMTRARWESLPKATRRQLADIQHEVDLVLVSKQREIITLIPKNCLYCNDKEQIATVSQRFKVKDAFQEQRMNSLMEMLLADPEPEQPVAPRQPTPPPDVTPEPEEDARSTSSRGSQRSSIYFTQAKTNLLKRGLASGISKLRKKTGRGGEAGDHSSMPPPLMAALAILNRWRESGKAWDVPLQRTNPKQKIGLRLEKKKGLQVLGFDPGTPAEALQDIIPIGSYLVAVDYNPVSKMDAMFKQLMSGSEVTMTFATSPVSGDPQRDLDALLREEAAAGLSLAEQQSQQQEPVSESSGKRDSVKFEGFQQVIHPPSHPTPPLGYTTSSTPGGTGTPGMSTPAAFLSSLGVAPPPPPPPPAPPAPPPQPLQVQPQQQSRKGLFEDSDSQDSHEIEAPCDPLSDPLSTGIVEKNVENDPLADRRIPDNLSDRADDDRQSTHVLATPINKRESMTLGSLRMASVSSWAQQVDTTPSVMGESVRDDVSIYSAFTAAEDQSGSVPKKEGWLKRIGKKKPKPKQTPHDLQEDAFPTF
eukprot:TRINITY_DN9646_c0_g1_i3.p1 TRINITY_DN9646_c0_g1~~TRINITY_DN9646_c0_g1_i3.p1  ORF type:complete len:771 (+),score=110.41 TRINITY_DN9646_c0_g1_i3:87-2315(+)